MARGRTQRHNRPSFKPGFDALREFAATVGGANAPETIAGAKILVKGIKQAVGDKGGRSVPGQPPRKRQGDLQRSIGTDVDGGVRRVGSGDWKAPILEFGMVTQAHAARAAKGRRKAKGAAKSRVIEPRPFMHQGLENAKAMGMTDVIVGTLQKKPIKGLMN